MFLEVSHNLVNLKCLMDKWVERIYNDYIEYIKTVYFIVIIK